MNECVSAPYYLDRSRTETNIRPVLLQVVALDYYHYYCVVSRVYIFAAAAVVGFCDARVRVS